MKHWIRGGLAALALAGVLCAQSGRSYGPGRIWWEAGQGGLLPWEEAYDNPDGLVTVLNRNGAVHTEDHPFFEPLGVNGRACVTCHQPANAMSVSTASLRERWRETQGKDPVFAAVDGSNCPDLPQAAIASHSLLLDRGLFRIFLPWPPMVKPEFRIEVVRDPTGCNRGGVISVYRRPRIAANLDAVVAGPEGPAFMADGREPSLRTQAINAAMGHEEARTQPSDEQLRRIVEFESQIYTAQSADIRGGLLNEKEGPAILGSDNLAAGKAGGLGSAMRAATLFDVWRQPPVAGGLGLQLEFRASVARGSDVFFTRCASCHTAGTTRWMDIGTTNRPSARESAELPLFRVTCESGREIYSQDPGRALISGKCADIGAIVVPQLRGLAARAPYFSNGSATSLREVVEFYEGRFGITYTEREKQDLLNFLRVL